MQLLRNAMIEYGKLLDGEIINVDAILTHQLDTKLLSAIGEEIAERFQSLKPTRVLTVETSGLAPALMAALSLNIPMVFARKRRPITMSGRIFVESAPSMNSKGEEITLLASSEFLPEGERILLVDDFLSTGKTIDALAKIAISSGSELIGIAVVIEKMSTNGREYLETLYDCPIESLVRVSSVNNKIEFV